MCSDQINDFEKWIDLKGNKPISTIPHYIKTIYKNQFEYCYIRGIYDKIRYIIS